MTNKNFWVSYLMTGITVIPIQIGLGTDLLG